MLSAREIARLAGFSKPWMLNHLEREGIFIAETPRTTRHGKHRSYTFKDLVVLRAINRLLQLGARPKRIKNAMLKFSEVCPDIIGDVSMQARQLKFASSAGHFVVTENSVLFLKEANEIIDLINCGQLTFSFMIDNNSCTLPSLNAANEVINLSRAQRAIPITIETIARKHAI